MEEQPKLSHYQRYKDSIITSKKKWLENPENKAKQLEWSRKGVMRNYYKKKEMIEKYKELEKLIKK